MNRQQLIETGKYIQFPNSTSSYKDYSELPGNPEIIKLPLTDRMYTKWYFNRNHFLTSYHIDTVLPTIAEMLNVPFSMNDFTIDEKKSGNNFDISILKFKNDAIFDIYGLSTKETFTNVNYDFLTTSHI